MSSQCSKDHPEPDFVMSSVPSPSMNEMVMGSQPPSDNDMQHKSTPGKNNDDTDNNNNGTQSEYNTTIEHHKFEATNNADVAISAINNDHVSDEEEIEVEKLDSTPHVSVNPAERLDVKTVSSDYDIHEGRCAITNFKTMQHNLRGVDPNHVQSTASLLEKDYLEKQLTIDVLFLDKVVGDIKNVIDESGYLLHPAHIVDGRHRYEALQSKIKDPSPIWQDRLKSIPVHIWIRKNGTAINNQEAIRIGEMLNHVTESSLKMSFVDKIHGIVSIIRTTVDKDHKTIEVHKINVRAIATLVESVRYMSSLSLRTRERYAQVALMFARFPASFRKLKYQQSENVRKLSISHLSNAVLLNSLDQSFINICLDTVLKKLSATTVMDSTKLNDNSNWEVLRGPFYNAMQTIYNGIKSSCMKHNLQMNELLDQSLEVCAGTSITIAQIFVNDMVKFRVGTGHSKALERRMGFIMRHVNKAIEKLNPKKTVNNSNTDCQPGHRRVVQSKDPQIVANNEVKSSTGQAAPDTGDMDKQSLPRRRSARIKKVTNYNESQIVKIQDMMHTKHNTGLSKNTIYSKSPGKARRSTTGKSTEKRKHSNMSFHTLRSFVEDQPQQTVEQWLSRLGFISKKKTNLNFHNRNQNQHDHNQHRRHQRYNITVAPNSSSIHNEDAQDINKKTPLFDDSVPSELPFGIQPSTPYRPDLYGSHAKSITYDSKCLQNPWTVPNPPRMGKMALENRDTIANIPLYLNACCIPQQHRAHVLLEKDLLISSHVQVWWNIQRTILSLSSDDALKRMLAKHKIEVDNMQSRHGLLARLITNHVVDLQPYFAKKATELQLNGFTTIDGVFLDYGASRDSLPCAFDDPDWFQSLFDHLMETFENKDTNQEKEFVNIFNRDTAQDKQDYNRGEGRYQSTRYGVMEALESDKSRVKYAKYRALADVRMGMILGLMRLTDQTTESSAVYCPNTGSRALINTPGCSRQRIHSDREAMGRRRTILLKENPGYFVIATAKDPAYYWVVPGSHTTIAKTKAKYIPLLSNITSAELRTIPPYSLEVCRADFQHAGAGGIDYPNKTTNKIRFHNMFFPSSAEFPDAIHFVPNYNPSLINPSNHHENSSQSSEEYEDDGENTNEEGGISNEVHHENYVENNNDEEGISSEVQDEESGEEDDYNDENSSQVQDEEPGENYDRSNEEGSENERSDEIEEVKSVNEDGYCDVSDDNSVENLNQESLGHEDDESSDDFQPHPFKACKRPRQDHSTVSDESPTPRKKRFAS